MIKQNFVNPNLYAFDPTDCEPIYDDGKTQISIMKPYAQSKYKIEDLT
jgi:hypothetical protein